MLLVAGATGVAIPAVTLKRATDGAPVDLRAAVAERPGRTLVIYGVQRPIHRRFINPKHTSTHAHGACPRTPSSHEAKQYPPRRGIARPTGTYAADFNMIEYAQQTRHYWPALQSRGVDRALLIVNSAPAAASKLGSLLSLPDELELLSDEAGEAGRGFFVGRGWLPDDSSLQLGPVSLPVSPYAKLLGMLVGLGASGTLPSVIAGYLVRDTYDQHERMSLPSGIASPLPALRYHTLCLLKCEFPTPAVSPAPSLRYHPMCILTAQRAS